jgi:hypothetical protein
MLAAEVAGQGVAARPMADWEAVERVVNLLLALLEVLIKVAVGADQGSFIGGSGGSGILIIAYPDTSTDLLSVSAGLTCNGSSGNTVSNTTYRTGYKVYRFTAGTGTISW